MKITVAKSAGFCFGVRRAVDMAMAQAGPAYSLGEIIHNRFVIAALEQRGIVTAEHIHDIPAHATVLIRAHGTTPAVYAALKEKGCVILDATCPFVAKIHKIAQSEPERTMVILGTRNHPEVEGIFGWCENGLVFENDDEVSTYLNAMQNLEIPIGVVAQTTINREKFKKTANIIKKECTNAKIFDTICSATDERQIEARRLAGESDLMVVIGDCKSSNTKRLYEISKELCEKTILIEKAEDLDRFSLEYPTMENIGITAGASTPAWIIKEVTNRMSTKFETGEDFAAMLEESFKTLNTGDKVTALVVGVAPNELQVDLGVKHAGFIPSHEMSEDPNYKLEENVKVGDEIEVIVVRVNDVEGTIMLSKKRIDQVRGWEIASKACDDKEIVEGIVIEENKGGVVATYSSVRVFIPASQTGLPREAAMSQLLKQKVNFRITEVNRAKRRVVGSIKMVMNDARKEVADKVWETIEAGTSFKGTVKSITTYGAFVDIGGVDGMVHISELSWNRVKHPSEVVKVGDEIDVYVISLDKEKRKISLGHKKADENPWAMFTVNNHVDDIVSVKVLKFMPFGAFAEIIPGVDGLIHISQISDKRIAKADEVLTIGQEVDAKIIDIDLEKKKVSLSIREVGVAMDEDYESAE